MAREQARLRLDELHELKHLIGVLMTLLSFWALISLDTGAAPLIFVAMVTCLTVLVRPRLLNRIPKSVWRFVGPFLLVVVCVDFLLSLPGLIPPLVRMMVWLLLYRNLAPRRQREDMQLVLLCLFSVILSGALTVSLLFAFQILLFAPLAMALLLLVCLLDRGPDSKDIVPTWEDFRWPRMLRRLRGVLELRALVVGAVLFAFVVAVSTLLFVLTPRFNLDQSIPFLQMETQSFTGFSDEVNLGDVSSIVQNRAVAVRVDVPSIDALGADPYWRMLVLDQYKEGAFTMSEDFKKSGDRRTLRENNGRLRVGERKGELWTFYMEGGVSRFLPLSGAYGVMRFQVPQKIDLYEFARVYGLESVSQSVFSYQIEDLRFDRRFPAQSEEVQDFMDREQWKSADELSYPGTTLSLALAQTDRSALAAINAEIIGEKELGAAGYSKAATDYLWNRFSYSLQPDGQTGSGGASEDPVVNWLLSGSRGHCELFASAFALLAREAGYPTRMVVGFVGGSWNSVEDYFVMRQSDAHAWVEIFDGDSNTWLRVDPTPGRGSSDPTVPVSGSLQYERGWNAWLDSLRIQWYRRIVNFEQEDQVALAMALKDMASEWSKDFKGKMKGLYDLFVGWLKAPFSADSLWRGLIPVGLLVLGYLLWLSRGVLGRWFFGSTHAKRRLKAERKLAGRYLKRLREHGPEGSDDAIEAELQLIRYGPDSAVSKSEEVFASAKRFLRKRKV